MENTIGGIIGICAGILVIVLIGYWILFPILIHAKLGKIQEEIEKSNKHLERIHQTLYASWERENNRV